MTFERIVHPFMPASSGRCLYPIRKADSSYTACGKMQGLHATVVKVTVGPDGSITEGAHSIMAARAEGLPLLVEVVET